MDHGADRDQAQLLWARGELVPARITEALDVAELFGPEVDLSISGRPRCGERWRDPVDEFSDTAIESCPGTDAYRQTHLF